MEKEYVRGRPKMRECRFGVVGLGMMGKEFASAASRWVHLQEDIPAPKIVGVSSATEKSLEWFRRSVPGIKAFTTEYRELLAREDIDAVYIATPHNLHRGMCLDVLRAGKHLICEKPFGIDAEANRAIVEEARKHPELLVRCASQMIFLPGARMVLEWFRERRFGRILQIKMGFKHSSDINPLKPINWKRRVETNGEYGVMGDLAPHILLMALRAGVEVEQVYADLRNIVHTRPGPDGQMVPCDTWDNALLLTRAHWGEDEFPMEVEVSRIAPGSPNDWFIEVYGMQGSIRYSTEDANAVYAAEIRGVEQVWTKYEVGYTPVYRTVTGPLGTFGFSDAILQMWAAYLDQWQGNTPKESCMTPEEARRCHEILTAALISQREGRIVRL